MFPNEMITVLVFLMLYDCELKNARICSMLKQVSTHSFEIYMFSGVFDSVIFGILRRNVSASFNVQILYLPLTTFASLLLSLGAAWLLKKQLSIIKMCCAFVFERLKS